MNFIGRQPGKITVPSNGISTIRGHVRKNPDRRAVSSNEKTLTYRELWERSSRIANAMIKAGLSKNDLVITYMPNSAHIVLNFCRCRYDRMPYNN